MIKCALRMCVRVCIRLRLSNDQGSRLGWTSLFECTSCTTLSLRLLERVAGLIWRYFLCDIKSLLMTVFNTIIDYWTRSVFPRGLPSHSSWCSSIHLCRHLHFRTMQLEPMQANDLIHTHSHPSQLVWVIAIALWMMCTMLAPLNSFWSIKSLDVFPLRRSWSKRTFLNTVPV